MLINESINGLFFSNNSNHFIACLNSVKSTEFLYESKNVKEVVHFKGHTRPVVYADYSNDNNFVATCGWDTNIIVYDRSGHQKQILSSHT